jgi:hypothetical protein
MNLAIEADHGAATVGEFVQVLLPKDDGTRGAQAADDFGIFSGNPVFVLRAGGGGERAGGVEKIFESDGNALERAAVGSALNFLFGATGVSERGIGRYCNECIELRIQVFDAGETIAREFYGGDCAAADLLA